MATSKGTRKSKSEKKDSPASKEHAGPSWDYEVSLKGHHTFVAGVDEVGRGCLAGPVYAAAVIVGSNADLWSDLNDSKKLTKRRRESLNQYIYEQAVGIGIGTASVAEIDKFNILHAARIAMARAVLQLQQALQHNIDLLLVDGTYEPLWPDVPIAPTRTVVEGDAKCPSIAAASIVAKVARDNWMGTLATSCPGYGFERNAGYGTKEHLLALKTLGPSDHHRHSFAPVARHLQSELNLYG